MVTRALLVLVVEDEAGVRELLSLVLSTAGFQVVAGSPRWASWSGCAASARRLLVRTWDCPTSPARTSWRVLREDPRPGRAGGAGGRRPGPHGGPPPGPPGPGQRRPGQAPSMDALVSAVQGAIAWG